MIQLMVIHSPSIWEAATLRRVKWHNKQYLHWSKRVMGILLTADGLPVEVYVETAPTVYVLGSSISFSWGVDGQLGFRYYF